MRSLVPIAVAVLAAAAVASALETSNPQFLVFPPPVSIETSGDSFSFAINTKATTTTTNNNTNNSLLFHLSDDSIELTPAAQARLDRGFARYHALVVLKLSGSSSSAAAASSSSSSCPPSTKRVEVAVHDIAHTTLNEDTQYSYSIKIDGCNLMRIDAASIYGAMYGMESFLQLVQQTVTPTSPLSSSSSSSTMLSMTLPHTTISITDAPSYAWRGIMIDSGRRFFPLPLVQNLLDTFAASKLNVLHLHASDQCRFGIESKLYPNLTAALVGDYGGFYTQIDIATMIAYAGDRGIRVVLELDVPGHSRGFIPIESQGIVYCEPNDPTRTQIYGDPSNSTLNTLKSLFSEITGLFEDQVFHIGCDETSALGPCTVQSTFLFEQEILNYVQTTLQKTPAGWEEVLFDANAATSDTIVFSWTRHAPSEVTATGRRVVDNNASHFYFTSAAPGGPAGWSNVYYDISSGIPSSQLSLLLGGEMSMWSDTYCITDQCGASTGPTPYAASLFPPQRDAEFSQSIGGMIFPRGFVGASAFWNYNASVDPSDPAFVASIWSLNNQIIQQGGYTCPTNCSCDQLSACGVPYIVPTPPSANTPLSGQVCEGGIGVGQRWIFNESPSGSGSGTLSLAANTSLCVQDPGAGLYPLVLNPCNSGTGIAVWNHNPATSELIQSATGLCLDMRTSDFVLGTYECGSGSGLKQPNQEWAVDVESGVILSLDNGYCVTAPPPTHH